ncbi:NUDIX domain-containing protein [Paracoccus spongiarum]|uniref:ADP-ribose pyrophosphatase n=1 Tax=Paracoccus spongiarum TaxID=3064387 RepID=A0ABT9JDI7_9RHOB|nr:NUDIX domain-containing protein [Paracoccus sp. 2205BS29-5]MDP5307899.1 NUDIX domain-containing protein [Paracoccus sp. 2205BS29-5]
MSRRVLLAGPLADPRMMAAIGLRPGEAGRRLAGGLHGGRMAGIEAGGWPVLSAQGAGIMAVPVPATPRLSRYAAVMGLAMVETEAGPLLGVQPGGASEAADASGWQGDLAAGIAAELLDAPEDTDPATLAARLPMIGVWVQSRMRAAAGPVSGGDLVARRGAGDVLCHDRRTPFAGYFAVETWDLSHRTHEGGFSARVRREGFVMGDAVVVLPWDPQRDRVLLIEQFRFAPALRHDPQPWLLEPIAGRIDAGETVEDAARREALEEADLRLGRMFPAVNHYPSPGAITEYLHLFVGAADLPDGSVGIHGLDGEAEDIRGHLVTRARLSRMVRDGQISNGPLAMLSLWLDLRADEMARELAGS